MGRNKALKFKDNAERRNVIEPGKKLLEKIKGNWHKIYFKNSNPIVLELACGRGEYTIGLARKFRDKNFIGVDIKGARIWRGSKIADEENLENVAFLRIHIQNLQDYFEENEVDDIWIVHPDPRSKKRDIRRRLTNPRFLNIYKKLMKPEGSVFLKTDNTRFFEYSLEVLDERADVQDLQYTFDLYSSPYLGEHHGIRTRYEEMFESEGEQIKYLKFKFK